MDNSYATVSFGTVIKKSLESILRGINDDIADLAIEYSGEVGVMDFLVIQGLIQRGYSHDDILGMDNMYDADPELVRELFENNPFEIVTYDIAGDYSDPPEILALSKTIFSSSPGYLEFSPKHFFIVSSEDIKDASDFAKKYNLPDFDLPSWKLSLVEYYH